MHLEKAGELAKYTFRKKALFSSLLRGPAVEWYDNNITNTTICENVWTNFITRFSDGQTSFGTEWKWNTVLEEMEKKFEAPYILSKKLWLNNGLTMGREHSQETIAPKGLLKRGDDDNDILTSQWKDLDQDTDNKNTKISARKR